MANNDNAVVKSNTTEPQKYYRGSESIIRKMSFASGEMVYQLPWMLVSAFLAIFMTDVALIPAGIVSSLFLICRVWDAINDPLIGTLADRTNTKLGRYRPWMLFGAVAMIPTVMLMFWAHPEWDLIWRIIYSCGLYFLAVVFSTSFQIPYTALNGVISPYPKERASFSSVRVLVASLAAALTTAIFVPMLTSFAGESGDMVRGYALAALVTCAISIPFVATCIMGTKEAIKAPPKKKFTFKDMFNNFIKNPPLMILSFAFLVHGFMVYGRMTVSAFYFTYMWGDLALFSLFATVNGLVTAFAAMLTPLVIKIFKTKRSAMMFTYASNLILHIILFFLTPENSSAMTSIVIRWGTGIFTGLSMAFLYSFIGDTVEYGQWKTGIRADGLSASGTSLMTKLGGAIGPSVLLALLAANGYVANAEVQTMETITTLNATMNLLPAALSLIILVLFMFYKLDDKMHEKIVADLKERGEYNVH